MRKSIILIFMVVLSFSSSYADCVAQIVDPEKQIIINKDNYLDHEFNIKIYEPNKSQPDFYSFNIDFPKKFNSEYSFSYSKALFSENGKLLLSYNPEPHSGVKLGNVSYGISANSELISCLSLVNIYRHNTKDYYCGPEESITIDLASFINPTKECNNSHANNYY